FYMADLIQNKNDSRALTAATDDTMACSHFDDSERPMATNLAKSAASRVLAQGENETQITLGVLKDVVRRLSASPGQREIVFISPGFYVTINYRPDETAILDSAIRASVTISSLDARGLYVPDTDITQNTASATPFSAVAKSQYER